jgi:glycosyltransferase involved in cell wall biosynthesis
VPLVTTIIPVFNRPRFLREAVDSVLVQRGCELQVVIVDDGSTDDTSSVAAELAATYLGVVEVVSQANAGPGAARQAGLETARGDFVQFLDSDDLLLPDKFATQIAALAASPEAGIAYGKTYTRVTGTRQPAAAQRSAEVHTAIFPALLAGRIWETSTPLYRREALPRIGPWPRRRQMEDWEFDAQAAAAGIRLVHCDSWVAEYRVHGEHRLAHAWLHDTNAMRDRLAAYLAIAAHVRTARVDPGCPEMKRFARTLFWVARNAGLRGFEREAVQLLASARELSRADRRRAAELAAYRWMAALFGWARLGAWSERLDAIRAGRSR